MVIKLNPLSTGSKFDFPALPERVKVRTGAKYQSFDIISLGTVKVPKGTDIEEVTWDGEFFGSSKRNEAIVLSNYWREPNECVSIIKNYLNNATPLNLIITDIGINIDVTIASFDYEAYGAFGNIKYSITFAQKKQLQIFDTNELQVASFVQKTVVREESAAAPADEEVYEVKSGDTLSKISLRKYGSASQWTKIYDANSDVIEQTAKQHGKSSSDHGHWIWPGENLNLPS